MINHRNILSEDRSKEEKAGCFCAEYEEEEENILYYLIFKGSLALGVIIMIWVHKFTENYKKCPEGDFLRHLVEMGGCLEKLNSSASEL